MVNILAWSNFKREQNVTSNDEKVIPNGRRHMSKAVSKF
jgi:hypothetical protein